MVRVTLTDAEAQTVLQAITSDQQRTRKLIASIEKHNGHTELLRRFVGRLDGVCDKLIEAGTWDFGRANV